MGAAAAGKEEKKKKPKPTRGKSPFSGGRDRGIRHRGERSSMEEKDWGALLKQFEERGIVKST